MSLSDFFLSCTFRDIAIVLELEWFCFSSLRQRLWFLLHGWAGLLGRLMQETLPAGSGIHQKEVAVGGSWSAAPGAAAAVVLGLGWWLVCCCSGFWGTLALCSEQPTAGTAWILLQLCHCSSSPVYSLPTEVRFYVRQRHEKG